ncbi:hypothetical protein D3C81_1949810 [compost metagenome]
MWWAVVFRISLTGVTGFSFRHFCCLCGPLRGHARSHRITTGLEYCAVPVGAGAPAKKQTRCHGKGLATRAGLRAAKLANT